MRKPRRLFVEALRRDDLAGDAGDRAGLEQDVGIVGRQRNRFRDILVGAGDPFLAQRKGGGEVPGEGIGGDELQPLIDIRAGRNEVAGRDGGARAVEMDFAAKLGSESGDGERGIERLSRFGRIARGEPAVPRLGPEIGAARILRGFRLGRRLLERRRRRRPAPERGVSKAEALARLDAAALEAPVAGRRDRLLGRGLDERGAASALGGARA